jgi:hypothetical protein
MGERLYIALRQDYCFEMPPVLFSHRCGEMSLIISMASDHVPEAMSICFSKDIIFGRVAAMGVTI